ncbi:MAG: Electron transport complex protein rnfG [Candidatus Magnetoglobus multicellularis str. Araruama]|uniref:Electron transport complex protein rnfG n=1 Tax=Candidatus Magnetoglobus multicellularis str. Araruama TaxID=890399 RepID=A0A1V1PER7_9BACT|nr:MAG: Electron transport complex protein rnfG [Candidatus Magnetoglobus multicellularis str. Araruama]
MKEILKITIGLTLTCLIAAGIMGGVFIITAKAKKHNEYVNFKENMLKLLGYDKNKPAPDSLQLCTVYRYLIYQDDKTSLGYMIPVTTKGSDDIRYQFIRVSIQGQFIDQFDLNIETAQTTDQGDRDNAIKTVLPKDVTQLLFADTFIVATNDNKRLAYLLPGKSPGFKTHINFMLALDSQYAIVGLQILEHQEDPGLGAEIEQEYFKNQFTGKDAERLKTLKVIKEPIPDEQLHFLEQKKWAPDAYSENEIAALQKKYLDKDICAITGATISSVAVVNGVKNVVTKFVYRVKVLENIISKQNINVAF